MRSGRLLASVSAAAFLAALAPVASAAVGINTTTGTGGPARLTGNSFAGGSAPGGISQTSTQAQVTIVGSGGSGSTSGGLGNSAGTIQYGTATTNIIVSATPTEFRVHLEGSGQMNAPAGYTNLSISASVGFFDTSVVITGAGAMPFTIQKTGGLAGVTWALVPEAGTGASIVGSTLTAGTYRFEDGGSSPDAFIQYNFGNGGTGVQQRTFAGDFAVIIGGGASGVCCRGATCNAAVAQASCTASGAAGASFAGAAAACNSGGSSTTPCCFADYNKIGGRTVADIFAYLTDWFALRPAAVVGGNGTTGTPVVGNIFQFLTAWFAGGC